MRLKVFLLAELLWLLSALTYLIILFSVSAELQALSAKFTSACQLVEQQQHLLAQVFQRVVL